MSDKMKTVLCGGTFFVLLSHIRRTVNDADLFQNLCSVIDEDIDLTNNKNLKQGVSKFKLCQSFTGELFDWDNQALLNKIGKEITQGKYCRPLSRMNRFIHTSLSLNSKNHIWLVSALLETIANDEIDDDTPFYISKQKPYFITKKRMLEEQHFELGAFLLGVWYYILSKKIDNSSGRPTIEKWHQITKDSKGRDRYHLEFVNLWEKPIFVTSIFEEKKESKKTIEESDSYYLNKTIEQMQNLKTFFFRDAPKRLLDYYVCNDIVCKEDPLNPIHDISVLELSKYSNYILLTGSTGIGKTMMMRHLTLDACSSYEELKKLPVYMPLSEYEGENLKDYLFREVNRIGETENPLDFTNKLEEGKFIFILDGIDEISQKYILKFSKNIRIFLDRYNKNLYIFSSRSRGDDLHLNHCCTFEIQPFTKDQAKAMVDTIAADGIREQLKLMIDCDIDDEYSYWRSPLLLTLMVRNFDEFKDVPATQHIYYHEVYKTLFRHLDKSKGLEKRRSQTGLNAERLSDYFSEFCALAYMQDKQMFTDYEFDKMFYKISERAKESNRVSASDFRDDLIENVGLLIYENGRIHFWHKSLQEYFCALYYANCTNVDLKKYKAFFAKIDEKTDKNLCSLYINMNLVSEEKFHVYVIYPYLIYLFETCLAENGYWSFLSNIYHCLSYNTDKVSIEPFSFLFKSIFYGEDYNGTHANDLHLPFLDDFLYEIWVKSEDSYCESDCYYRNRFGFRCLLSRKGRTNIFPLECKCRGKYSESDILFQEYVIYFDDIYKDREKYQDLVKYLESDDFCLKKIYNQLLSVVLSLPYTIKIHKTDNER